jgi:AraC-like DNA-binding protein
MTPRYVHLLLEETGRSFSEHVLDRRLCLSQCLLTDPNRASVKISNIAFECGFTDLSYFNRTFRRRFGATPSEMRAASVRGKSQD